MDDHPLTVDIADLHENYFLNSSAIAKTIADELTSRSAATVVDEAILNKELLRLTNRGEEKLKDQELLRYFPMQTSNSPMTNIGADAN